MRRAVSAAWLCLLAGTAAATDYRANAQDYLDYVRRLQPGDRLLLEAGDYRQGLPLRHLSGEASRPIVIEAALPAEPPRFLARPGANTISLVDVRHLVLRHLELDGRNQPVDAVKAEGHSRYADFITLDRLYIHDHAASQQNVGISTKCPAFGWDPGEPYLAGRHRHVPWRRRWFGSFRRRRDRGQSGFPYAGLQPADQASSEPSRRPCRPLRYGDSLQRLFQTGCVTWAAGTPQRPAWAFSAGRSG